MHSLPSYIGKQAVLPNIGKQAVLPNQFKYYQVKHCFHLGTNTELYYWRADKPDLPPLFQTLVEDL